MSATTIVAVAVIAVAVVAVAVNVFFSKLTFLVLGVIIYQIHCVIIVIIIIIVVVVVVVHATMAAVIRILVPARLTICGTHWR